MRRRTSAARPGAAGRWTSALEHGLDTLLVPRFYHGRLVDLVQREDHAGAAVLKRLDRLATAIGADNSGFDFDALVEEAASAGAVRDGAARGGSRKMVL
jgi:hypothetical protein